MINIISYTLINQEVGYILSKVEIDNNVLYISEI